MRQPRILWADDEIVLLRPHILFLQQKGYEVRTALSGRDAVELFGQESFDIVFLDENMPGQSGLETLTEIKQIRESVPVVMITKSEEEHIMDQAIGEKIADYLIKPVNPSQILLTLKKHVHSKEIIQEHTDSGYRQEFTDISYMIDTATTSDEWAAIQRTLVKWEIELGDTDSPMRDMLRQQRQQANRAFAKFIARNYPLWFEGTGPLNSLQGRPTGAAGQGQEKSKGRPLLSHDIFKAKVLPALDKGEKVYWVVIDNFRYDQWKAIQPLLAEWFTVEEEQTYYSILPTATQYGRNALFAGLTPLQIQEMYPEYWVEEDEEEGKNLKEKELIQTVLDRYRKRYTYTYNKINESDYCEKVIQRMKGMTDPLNVIVINFIDMLSHSRTESKMMRELAHDETAYRSLTVSWFKHSPTLHLFRAIAEAGYKIVLTTDHGTIHVNNPVQIIGDRNTNTNLRYKVGKSLTCKSKDIFIMENPKQFGLPMPNVSSSYMYCTANDFFSYPNNFNQYVQYYRDTFQHGGVSMEEMIVPLVTLKPKQ